MMGERRKYQRYKISDKAFVFGTVYLGRITDISLAGMAFSSICQHEFAATESISILDSENEFVLEKIPCQAVASAPLPSDFPASSVPVAKVHLSFCLTPVQQVLLEAYLINHAIGNA